MKKWLLILVPLALAGVVLIGVLWIRGLYRGAAERHARACLEDAVGMADDAVGRLIPGGKFAEAIEAARYIKGYYPPGSVLPAAHPFAPEYQRGRETQISRIVAALEKTTGLHHGRDWAAWKKALPGLAPAPSP